MSVQATSWVLREGPRLDDVDRKGKPYRSRARGYRAILLTIADAANRDGEHAHPGNAAIVEGSLYGKAQALAIIGDLVKEGWLEVTEKGNGRGNATVYRVVMDRRERVQLSDVSHVEGTVQSSDASGEANGPVSAPKLSDLEAETVQSRGATPITQQNPSTTASAPVGARTTGTRLADQFVITSEMRDWATTEVPGVDLRDQTRRFCDYWRAQPGARGRKVDWIATWRNWMRKAHDDLKRRPGGRANDTIAQIGAMKFDENGMIQEGCA